MAAASIKLPPLSPVQALTLSHSLSGIWEGSCISVAQGKEIVSWKGVELFFNIEANRTGTVNGKGSQHAAAAAATSTPFLLEGVVMYPLCKAIKVNLTNALNSQEFVLTINEATMTIEGEHLQGKLSLQRVGQVPLDAPSLAALAAAQQQQHPAPPLPGFFAPPPLGPLAAAAAAAGFGPLASASVPNLANASAARAGVGSVVPASRDAYASSVPVAGEEQQQEHRSPALGASFLNPTVQEFRPSAGLDHLPMLAGLPTPSSPSPSAARHGSFPFPLPGKRPAPSQHPQQQQQQQQARGGSKPGPFNLAAAEKANSALPRMRDFLRIVLGEETGLLYYPQLAEQGADMDSLRFMSSAQLGELGIALGPRLKLIQALQQQQHAGTRAAAPQQTGLASLLAEAGGSSTAGAAVASNSSVLPIISGFADVDLEQLRGDLGVALDLGTSPAPFSTSAAPASMGGGLGFGGLGFAARETAPSSSSSAAGFGLGGVGLGGPFAPSSSSASASSSLPQRQPPQPPAPSVPSGSGGLGGIGGRGFGGLGMGGLGMGGLGGFGPMGHMGVGLGLGPQQTPPSSSAPQSSSSGSGSGRAGGSGGRGQAGAPPAGVAEPALPLGALPSFPGIFSQWNQQPQQQA